MSAQRCERGNCFERAVALDDDGQFVCIDHAPSDAVVRQ